MYGTIFPYYLKEILPVKYIKQFLIILLFTFLGEALAYLLPFPIPAAIYGLVLLFAALYRNAAYGGPLLWVGLTLLAATIGCWFAASRADAATFLNGSPGPGSASQ